MGCNDVFLSYRRDVGGYVALALHQHLAASGIDTFFDIESIHTGRFDTIILNQIEARPYFVVILTPGTLDRCVHAGDWVRREIEHALETGRRIVPAHTAEFDPRDIERYLPANPGRALAQWQALKLPFEYFKYAAAELVAEYLVPVDIELTATPDADAGEVRRIQEATAAVPAVAAGDLTAQGLLERAVAALSAGQVDEALVDYGRAIELNPSFADAFYHRGLAWEKQRDVDAALADYDRAIELNSNYAYAFSNRGIIRLDRGELRDALADLERAVELLPDAAAFSNRGLVRQARAELDLALADYGRAIELDPNYAAAFSNRGTVGEELGEMAAALADYDRAIELDPDYTTALNNRGNTRKRLGDVAGALADYDRAVELEPDYATAFYNRANTRFVRDEFRAAIVDYDRAIGLDPNYATALNNRGLARMKLGDVEGAIVDFDRAIALGFATAIANRSLLP